MRWLLLIPVVTLAIVVGAVMALNLGIFHSQIEHAASDMSGGEVKLGPVSLTIRWPLTIKIGPTHWRKPGMDLTWQELIFETTVLTAPRSVTLRLDRPHLEIKGDFTAHAATQGTKTNPEKSVKTDSVGPLQLRVTLVDGEVDLPQGHLKALHFTFEQKQLLRSTASVHGKAFLEASAFPLRIPISIDSDGLTLTPETVKASDVKLFVGGLEAVAQGTSLLTEDRHRWKVTVSAPDLTKLPKPPMEIPIQDWRGAVAIQLEVTKGGEKSAWSADGDVSVKQFGAMLKYHQDKLTVQGPARLELEAHFQYANDTPAIPKLNGEFELSEARVVYQDMFDKAAGVPMSAKVTAAGDPQQLKLESLEFKFWNLLLKLHGETSLKAPYVGHGFFEIPALSLTGADKIILPLAKSPVQGQAQLRGEIQGALAHPMECAVKLEALQLKDFSAHVEYEKPGLLKARGPLLISLNANGEMSKGQVDRVQASGEVTLSETALVLGPLRKEAMQEFKVSFAARNAAKIVEIQRFDIESFFGKIKTKGRVKDPLGPSLEQFKIEIASLSLSELRLALPEWRDKIPKGSLSGQLKLDGRMASEKPWTDWPLNVEGSLRATLPDYKMDASEREPPQKINTTLKSEPPAKSEGFLSKGYLTSHLKMKLLVDIAKLSKDKLLLSGVHSDGVIDAGRFKGIASIHDIFSGEVSLTALDVPLLELRPAIAGALQWKNIVIQDAMAFAKPEYKDFATGRTAGTTEFVTYLPADKDFMSYLKAKGQATMEPVTMSSVKVGQMINDLLQKVPLIKSQPVKVEPLKGSMKMQFDLRAQVVQVENLLARDQDGSELQLKGKVDLVGMQGDLAGGFLWAKPQVKGCLLEGNSDAQGRMLIPVAIKGDLMHPGFSLISDMIGKLGGKALQCEQKKLVERVKVEGTKKLEEEVKKKLQGLFGK